jgi:hypothetical protein
MKGRVALRGREVGVTAQRRGHRRPWAVVEVDDSGVGEAVNEEGLGDGEKAW